MKCPVCNSIDLVIAERQGVEIDYCPQCRGIWLDRGEIDKIIERSYAPTAARSQTEQQNLYDSHRYPSHETRRHDGQNYGHNGKHQNQHQHQHQNQNQHQNKSWLSELFD